MSELGNNWLQHPVDTSIAPLSTEWPNNSVLATPALEAEIKLNPAEQSQPLVEKSKRPSTRSRVVAGVLILGVAIGSSVLISGENSPKADAAGTPTSPDKEAADAACVDGMFPAEPFESSKKAFGNELHERPAVKMTANPMLNSYLFGKSSTEVAGVACKNAPTISALTALYTDLLGGGNSSVSFGSTNPNELIAKYVGDKDAAKRDAKIVASGFSHAKLNDNAISGPMYRVSAKKTGTEALPYNVVYTQVAANIEVNNAFVLDWEDVINDNDASKANQEQILVIDATTGQILVAKAIGAEIEQTPEDKPADVSAADAGKAPDGTDGGGGSGKDGGTGGGKGGGEGGGCGGSCGSGSSGGSDGGGGGCGSCGGGGSTPPATSPPRTTATTSPPRTTATTSPPRTTATTSPPRTSPPATKPPITCDPNIDDC